MIFKKSNYTVTLTFFFKLGQLFTQDVYLPFKVNKLPVEFKYEKSFPIKEVKKYTYIASDGTSEFYIKITRIGSGFNGDSLKSMFFKIYDDSQIKNLQLRELTETYLGGKRVFKCALAFMAGDKWYLSTIYMVPFHINSKYNSVLFYFEMGESRAPSYAMIQEKMIETLKYTEFEFKNTKDKNLQFQTCMPEVWDFKNDSISGISILTDDRASLTIKMLQSADTLSVPKLVDLEKEKLKADNRFANSKIKAGTEKLGKYLYGKVSLVYEEKKGRITQKYLSNIWIIPIPTLKNAPGFKIEFSCPEEYSLHYEPLLSKILKCFDSNGFKPFSEL